MKATFTFTKGLNCCWRGWIESTLKQLQSTSMVAPVNGKTKNSLNCISASDASTKPLDWVSGRDGEVKLCTAGHVPCVPIEILYGSMSQRLKLVWPANRMRRLILYLISIEEFPCMRGIYQYSSTMSFHHNSCTRNSSRCFIMLPFAERGFVFWK